MRNCKCAVMCILQSLLSGYLELASVQIRLSPFPLGKAALLLVPEENPEMARNTRKTQRNPTFQYQLKWSQGMRYVFKRFLSFVSLRVAFHKRLIWAGLCLISTIVHANIQVCSFVQQNIVQCSPLNSLYLAVLASPPYPPLKCRWSPKVNRIPSTPSTSAMCYLALTSDPDIHHKNKNCILFSWLHAL